MVVANTPAYYDMATITVVKAFIGQAQQQKSSNLSLHIEKSTKSETIFGQKCE